jgi:hypothetical protein
MAIADTITTEFLWTSAELLTLIRRTKQIWGR